MLRGGVLVLFDQLTRALRMFAARLDFVASSSDWIKVSGSQKDKYTREKERDCRLVFEFSAIGEEQSPTKNQGNERTGMGREPADRYSVLLPRCLSVTWEPRAPDTASALISSQVTRCLSVSVVSDCARLRVHHMNICGHIADIDGLKPVMPRKPCLGSGSL